MAYTYNQFCRYSFLIVNLKHFFLFRPVIPVIYFCTRTHKQIEQVIKELQRTSFNTAK